MANFTYNPTASLSTSDGITVGKSQTGLGANAKVLFDDVIALSTTLDLAPLLVEMANPIWAIMVASGDGAKLKFDGLASFTSKAYKMFQLELTPNSPGPSGLLDLEIETNSVASQRIRFMAVGDPD